jgi:hypothetical protein
MVPQTPAEAIDVDDYEPDDPPESVPEGTTTAANTKMPQIFPSPVVPAIQPHLLQATVVPASASSASPGISRFITVVFDDIEEEPSRQQAEGDDDDNDECAPQVPHDFPYRVVTTSTTTTTTATHINAAEDVPFASQAEDDDNDCFHCPVAIPNTATTKTPLNKPPVVPAPTMPVQPHHPAAASATAKKPVTVKKEPPATKVKVEGVASPSRTRRASAAARAASSSSHQGATPYTYTPPESLPNVPRYLSARQHANFYRIVSRLIGPYALPATSQEQRDKILYALLCLPHATLTNMYTVSAKRRKVATKIEDPEGFIAAANAALASPPPPPPAGPTEPAARAHAHGERMRTKAEGFVYQGYLGKAAAALCTKDIPLPPLPQLVEQLEALHPKADVPLPVRAPEDFLAFIDPKMDLGEISRAGCRGKAPGPTGWTEELLHIIAVADEDSETGLAFRAILEDIINGNVSEQCADILASSVLMALPKTDTKVRPIAMGEALLRLAARVCIKTYPIAWSKHQYAFRPGGAELLAHEVRALVKMGFIGYSLDMENAFNRLYRWAFLEVIPDSLIRLVNMTYCRPGRLYLRQARRIAAHLCSERGVRQGDVLGPILFALAIEHILEGAAERFGVRCLAYLDDITVLSQSQAQVDAALAWMLAELEKIGLNENVSKRQTVSSLSPLPIKIVGAYVAGPEKAIQDALVSKVPAAFFEQLPRLHPTIAMLLLRVCGEPRFTFLARTHPPEQLGPSALAMDKVSYTALASILALPLEALMAETALDSRFLAALPLKMGGLAVTNWETLAPVAYLASSMGRSQKNLTQALYTGLLAADFKHVSKHAGVQAAKAASSFLHVPKDAAKNAPLAVIAATLYRINWCGNDVRMAKCPCSFEAERRSIWPHMVGCVKFARSNVNGRHHAIVRQLKTWCEEIGWSAQQEVTLDAESRIDLLVDTCSRTVMVDVTVNSPQAKTWATLSQEAVVKRVTRGKVRSYARHTSKEGELTVDLLTFYIDVFGALSAEATEFLRDIERQRLGVGLSAAKMAERLAALAVCNTALCAVRASILPQWGADPSLSLYCTGGQGPRTAVRRVVVVSEAKETAENEEAPVGNVSNTNTAAAGEVEERKSNLRSPAEMKELERKMFATAPSSRPLDIHGNVLPVESTTTGNDGVPRGEPWSGSADARFPNGGLLSDRPRRASAGGVVCKNGRGSHPLSSA